MIEIKDLHVCIEGKPILNGINLTINPGEIHVIMGPNGAGKSTLAKVFAGDEAYEVVSGSITFEGIDILELAPEERARLGLFMGFQYPVEIPGVSNLQFLYAAKKALCKAQGLPIMSEEEFASELDEKLTLLKMRKEFKERNVNEGFSGGEKKRNEILQMSVLDPKFSLLDETDSGLDIDAMRAVAEGINLLHTKEKALLLITHYQRLLEYIACDYIHVMIGGEIVLSGEADLAEKLEREGYDWIAREFSSCC
jgi:Fe-S cluster assembly ATP-binding protein